MAPRLGCRVSGQNVTDPNAMNATRPRLPKSLYVAGPFSMGFVDFYTFLIPLYGLSLALDATEIGMLVGARSLLALFLSIHIGVLMDRFGTRRVTLFFVWAGMALSPLFPLAPGFWALLLLQLITGAAVSFAWSGAQTLIAQHAEACEFRADGTDSVLRAGPVAPRVGLPKLDHAGRNPRRRGVDGDYVNAQYDLQRPNLGLRRLFGRNRAGRHGDRCLVRGGRGRYRAGMSVRRAGGTTGQPTAHNADRHCAGDSVDYGDAGAGRNFRVAGGGAGNPGLARRCDPAG